MEAQQNTQCSQILIARQPIVDRSGALIAYELLFRDGGGSASATFGDGALATTNVILNTVSEFGAERVLGTACGYVNIGQESLTLERLGVLAPERFTLELLESVQFDEATIEECRQLRAHGYTLALDDVTDLATIPREVLSLADIIKVDVSVASPDAIERILADPQRRQWRVLAEKVETPEQYLQLRDQGFDLFQGYFFARPQVLAQRRLPRSATTLMSLLKLLSEEPTVTQLETLVKKNPVLTARLMNLAQSAAYAKSDSGSITVRDAIMRVGTKALSRWVQLLLFAGDCETDLATNPLFQMVAVRARFMELLSQSCVPGDHVLSDAAYQTGVYSLLHVLTGQPQEAFLSEVSIPRAQRAAIESHEGLIGDMLSVAEAVDLDRSAKVALEHLGVSGRTILALHCQATLGVALDVRA